MAVVFEHPMWLIGTDFRRNWPYIAEKCSSKKVTIIKTHWWLDRSQGLCGSCWAYSVTGVLQSQYYNYSGQMIQMSQQNLIDCSIPEGRRSSFGEREREREVPADAFVPHILNTVLTTCCIYSSLFRPNRQQNKTLRKRKSTCIEQWPSCAYCNFSSEHDNAIILTRTRVRFSAAFYEGWQSPLSHPKVCYPLTIGNSLPVATGVG